MKIESAAELDKLFEAQGKRRWAIASTNASERIAKLAKLRAAIVRRQGELYEAISKDYRKTPFEAWLTEVFPSVAEIDHTMKGLRKWMKDERVAGSPILPGAKSYLRCEPKGRVLIMSPWNYPFQLLIAPLVSAIAAGDVVIAKPSNKTPATGAFLASLLAEVFPADEVAVVEGPGSVLGELLLALPFDHFFFTGSPRVGVHVGEAAERVHAGLTLELGGKSPTIVLPDADLADAATKILWGKCLNAGQTCIAPDYLFCPRALVPQFAAEAAAAVKRMYGGTAEERRTSPDFPRIVDIAACRRHEALVKDAIAKGAKLELGGEFDVEGRYAPPTILTGVTADMDIMAEEIFGPLLPILAYDSIEEVVDFIHERPKPLALYVFGRDRRGIDEILDRTTSGSACVNDLILQIENLELPFGGIGMSGTGNYHGRFGFRTFSHERNYMRQGPINMAKAFYPPYGGAGQKRVKGLVDLLCKLRIL